MHWPKLAGRNSIYERYSMPGCPLRRTLLPMPASAQLPGDRVDQALADRVDQAIQTNPYVNGRLLRFETDGSRVVLQGSVKSFFQKQMAQEVVRRVEGVEEIDNCLEVMWV